MPAISKIRLTNVVYEGGDKRFNDEVFQLAGNNAAVLLENGGGKTVFIHTVLQAVLPHTSLGERKIKETLQLENAPAHIGIEWIISEHPRRYLLTAVTLFLVKNELKSHKYVFEYEANHPDGLENMPFVKTSKTGERPAYKEEMSDYYSTMKSKTHNARTFDTLTSFHQYLEENYQIITNEWESIVKINRDEGGIEQFFENCKTTTDLYDRLLIPTVEDSIAGHEAGMFADMFEKQREGFQMYRQLQKSMQEHQAIQDELHTYVKEFQHYSDQAKAYVLEKQRAKGLADTLLSQRAATQKELNLHNESWEKWRADHTQLQMKIASLDILQEQVKANRFETDYLTKLEAYDTAKDNLAQNEQLFYSLTYAKKRDEQNTSKQLQMQYQTELEVYDQESEAADLETDLENEFAKLHGYYQGKLDEIAKVTENTASERRPVVTKIEELTQAKTLKEKQVQEERAAYDKLAGRLEAQIARKNDLNQHLLANPEQETVAKQFPIWQERQQWLDEAIIRLQHHKREAEQNSSQLATEQKEQTALLLQTNSQLAEEQAIQKQMHDAHAALVEQLAMIRPSWKTTKDIYLKVGSISGVLENTLEKLMKERDILLYKERLAHRFVDDYNEQESFFADAFLAERLHYWQSQFYVMTGVDFIADMEADMQAGIREYALWPLTLVTTAAEKATLLMKIEEVKENLQYPVNILTLDEVKQMNEGMLHDNWIAPSHWATNMDMADFTTWKQNIYQLAQHTTKTREEKEAELETCKQVRLQFQHFFATYPAEWKENALETLRHVQNEKATIIKKSEQIEEKLAAIRTELQQLDENSQTYQEQKVGFDHKLEKATEYFQVERDSNKLIQAQKNHQKEISKLENEMRAVKRDEEYYQAEKNAVDDRLRELEYERTKIVDDKQYNTAKEYQATFTNEAYQVIVDRIESLRFKLVGIRQAYSDIKTKFQYEQQTITRLETELEELVQTFAAIDVALIFPVDGNTLLEKARIEMKGLKANVDKHDKEQTTANANFTSQKARVQTIMERFEKDFQGEAPFIFEKEPDMIAEELNKSEQQMAERKAYLQVETERIETELTDITKAEQQLDRFSEAHHFNSTTLKAIALTEKELNAFSYARIEQVNIEINALQNTKEQLETAERAIDQAKRRFRVFCQEQITERKLREMAIGGMEQQQTYEEVQSFQQNMVTAIESADQYARNYITDQDKEVQAFINSIHNHLVNVTEQLKIIPKHTRVKVSDKWREIFKFNIPDWQEEAGKSRIRSHMDWILEQLEADNFKNEQGLEDNGKVRKHMETWLDTKQLLQIVMDNQVMKVACRKVTNDNQVTSKLTSWEHSKKWSGGEKWSKNMTLFLGILNFVAEKKQHIETKMKRQRAVILDNPFGKASSDHVLSPVFFIAEQLGFQMIALTAHADGKFLQDFFPIIYSLKLRTSMDQTKQIMTKEKSLHKAYFQDHEPEAMERLEEREQLELF